MSNATYWQSTSQIPRPMLFRLDLKECRIAHGLFSLPDFGRAGWALAFFISPCEKEPTPALPEGGGRRDFDSGAHSFPILGAVKAAVAVSPPERRRYFGAPIKLTEAPARCGSAGRFLRPTSRSCRTVCIVVPSSSRSLAASAGSTRTARAGPAPCLCRLYCPVISGRLEPGPLLVCPWRHPIPAHTFNLRTQCLRQVQVPPLGEPVSMCGGRRAPSSPRTALPTNRRRH